MTGALRRHEGKLWIAALVLAGAVLAVGLVVAPDVFWDKYLWEDIWGPTLADARHVGALCWSDGEIVDARASFRDGRVVYECPEGGTMARSGYTITAEITYGLVLAALLYVIYQHLLRRFDVDTGGGFILGLLPLILLGPVARVMEDARVFNRTPAEPGLFAPIFISPWIYFQIAFYAIAFLAVGVWTARQPHRLRRNESVVLAVLLVEFLAYVAVQDFFAGEFLTPLPSAALLALFGLAGYLVYKRWEGTGDSHVHATVFALGLPLLAPWIGLLGRWMSGATWLPAERGLAPLAGVLMVGFAVAITFLVWWVARLVGARRPSALRYAAPVNVALVFGHMVDGFATWIALKDPFNLGLGTYVEKHPVSDILVQAFPGTPVEGLLFPVAKLAMVLLVIHLLDKEFEKGEGERALGGLVKMAVFVLGFAPGVRDVLLVVMGF